MIPLAGGCPSSWITPATVSSCHGHCRRISGIWLKRRRHAADDAIGRAKTNYMGRHDPSFQTYGPRTRRELLTLARFEQG